MSEDHRIDQPDATSVLLISLLVDLIAMVLGLPRALFTMRKVRKLCVDMGAWQGPRNNLRSPRARRRLASVAMAGDC